MSRTHELHASNRWLLLSTCCMEDRCAETLGPRGMSSHTHTLFRDEETRTIGRHRATDHILEARRGREGGMEGWGGPALTRQLLYNLSPVFMMDFTERLSNK